MQLIAWEKLCGCSFSKWSIYLVMIMLYHCFIQENRFAKCDTCCLLKDEKSKTVDPERRKAFQALLDKHLELQRYAIFFRHRCTQCCWKPSAVILSPLLCSTFILSYVCKDKRACKSCPLCRPNVLVVCSTVNVSGYLSSDWCLFRRGSAYLFLLYSVHSLK